MEDYIPLELQVDIEINKIVTIHHFQYPRGYIFTGERHSFWEFVYMDKGSVNVGADGARLYLKEGEVIFHKPGEYHSIWVDNESTPSAIVVSFFCDSPRMECFTGKHLTVNEDKKHLLTQIISEARNAFANNINAGYSELKRKSTSVTGAEQTVKIMLELLLIGLLRDMEAPDESVYANKNDSIQFKSGNQRNKFFEHIANSISNYILDHIGEQITTECLCRQFNMCGTSLKNLFKCKFGMSFSEYLSLTRHNRSKVHIQEGTLNMSEIARLCGYYSSSYFTRRFKQLEGMTPSQYSKSFNNS